MSRRAGLASFPAFILILVAGPVAFVALDHAQQPPRPQFRSGVEYVQVDARVVDEKGDPIRGLTERDFQIFEDGVRQELKTFSVVDIPLPAPSTPVQAAAAIGVRPDVATNVRPSAGGRTFLIVFEAALVGRDRTLVVRKVLRDFIERSIAPNDLVGIVSTGLDRAFVNFTNDKARLIAAVNGLMGQGGGSPTVDAANDIFTRSRFVAPDLSVDPQSVGPPPGEVPIGDATTDDSRQAFRRLAEVIKAMSVGGEGSRAILLVSESVPVNLTNSDGMMPPEVMLLLTDADRLTAASRRGNVPIYPIYPRGLTDGMDDAVFIPTVELRGASPSQALLREVRRAQDNLRILADDTGGVPIVGTNDLAGGLDRVVKLSSYYYALGYDSTNAKPDGKFHRIEVKVSRTGARVVSRKGFVQSRPVTTTAASTLPGPAGSSALLRESLNAALPLTDLPVSLTAAAFRKAGGKGASTVVVLETLGADLAWGENGLLTTPLELAVAAIEPRGGIRTGEWGKMQTTQPTATAARVRNLGVRWLARLEDLPPGRHQIRGAISNGPLKQASVWHDLEIPDFSKTPLAMSDVVVASVVASQRLTIRPDKQLADVMPAPATAMRQFPPIDTLALYAEVYDNDPQVVREIETSVVVISERGEEKSREVKTLMADSGVARIQTRLPLAKLTPGRYTIAVEARQTANRAVATGRAVPFQIVDVGKK